MFIAIRVKQKNQSCHMNGVRVLTVKSKSSGYRVQSSFLSDMSMSYHHHNLLSYLCLEAYVIDVVCGSYFGA